MIGPNTGYLYAKNIFQLLSQKKFLEEAGANIVEIGLDQNFWSNGDKRVFSLKQGDNFDARHFKYRSMHFPVFSDELETNIQLGIVKKLIACQLINIVLIHPIKVRGSYPLKCYRAMISGGIPLAIENMDSRKDSGFEIKELRWLVDNLDLLFVLDVQHAYEHDPGMEYARDLFNSVKNSLTHLHVSGESNGNIHSLVYKSDNSKEIIDFAKMVLSKKNLPLVLEGNYQTPKELKKEIDFLKKELGSEF
jgi:hypothetical protein